MIFYYLEFDDRHVVTTQSPKKEEEKERIVSVNFSLYSALKDMLAHDFGEVPLFIENIGHDENQVIEIKNQVKNDRTTDSK